jgi:CDP-glucose 4,6-dehydratase
VREVADAAFAAWGGGSVAQGTSDSHKPEMSLLTLDTGKAQRELGWSPVWAFERAVRETMDWYAAEHRGADGRALCLGQISAYEHDAAAAHAPWSER